MQDEAREVGPQSARQHLGQRLVARPDLGAVAVATLCWAVSLFPTLLPRANLIQGGLTGVSAMVGYGVGGLILLAWRAVARRAGWPSPSSAARRAGRVVLAVSWVLLLSAGSWLWWHWQNLQRDLVGMPAISWRSAFNVILIALVLCVVLLAVSRLIAGGLGWIFAALRPRIGGPGARVVVGLVAVVAALLAGKVLIVDGVYASTDATYKAGDHGTDPGVHRPTSPLDSGGPGSLTPWSTLGLQGRTFAGGAVPKRELSSFAGPGVPVVQPIRVYAGLASAPTAEARAALAVRELERTGAFDRPVLVVATATGTGWVDPNAASAIEYMWHGNSAIVSIQYSYLPSWIAFLTETAAAADAGRALQDAVAARWQQLPADHRPRLVLFGQSLGSQGSDNAMAKSTLASSMDSVFAHGQSVLYTGPTGSNEIWHQLLAARAPSSPIWRPVEPSAPALFANSFDEIGGATTAPVRRIQYVQHASDPVTWWSMDVAWWPPEWITGPHGPDTMSQMIWFPFVTWLQTSADLIAGFSASVGHGHNYSDAFAGGFASVAAPPGWTSADTNKLAELLTLINAIGSDTGS
jgi:uncharacterized membrane protein